MDSLHIMQSVIGEGLARRTDQHAGATEIANDTKAVFVGQVIADKNRSLAGKRRLDHEGPNSATLVHARRHEFKHHDATLQLESGAARQILCESQNGRFQ